MYYGVNEMVTLWRVCNVCTMECMKLLHYGVYGMCGLLTVQSVFTM